VRFRILGYCPAVSINLIGIAVPFFFVLLGVEILVAHRKKRPLHRLNDSMADLTCGMGEQIVGIFTKAIPLAIYALVETQFGLFDLSTSSPWVWLAGLILVDHQYYWYHRFSHRVNFAWATHVVHHQSEEYNLAVALRQPFFTQLYSWLFYLPLALLGFPTLVWVTAFALNLLYQFWIHTRLIERMGPMEWVFNTPSHHRVHHGINDQYLDRNYAGMLIIWDRMYRTFEPEGDEVLYGTRRPLRSWNPLWANIEPWVHLAKLSSASGSLGEKLYAWIAPPEWLPRDSSELEGKDGYMEQRGYNNNLGRPLHGYVLLHLAPVAALMMWMITYDLTLPKSVMAVCTVVIIWTAVGWAGMFEGRSWALPTELARHVSLAAALVSLAASGGPIPATAVGLLCLAASMAWLLKRRGALRTTR
jgi:alkylglycerol monooxygenase